LQWKNLAAWFKKEGGTIRAKSSEFPTIDPSEDWLGNGVYRGMMAVDSIKKGEVVCSGPPKVIMSLARVPKGSLMAEVLASFPASMEISAFEKQQLWLIHEMANPTSPWRDYLCHIPRSYTFPIFWNDEQIREAEESG